MELENEAYERLLRHIAEADSTFDEADSDTMKIGQRDVADSDTDAEENMDRAYDDDSASEGSAIVRTSIGRKSRHAEYTVPLIRDSKYGTIAQRRNERH